MNNTNGWNFLLQPKVQFFRRKDNCSLLNNEEMQAFFLKCEKNVCMFAENKEFCFRWCVYVVKMSFCNLCWS